MNQSQEKQHRVGVIELLNDLGIRVIDIDQTLYAVEDFIYAESESPYIEIVGMNITSIIQNQTQTLGLSKGEADRIIQLISTSTTRRRKFSPNTEWKEYVSTQAHNA